ncbi:RnfABCDGE type electron transport complex subunit D [bacterium]|nr:RnfABCDGE type electron transport complex subunit D [bacterium]
MNEEQESTGELILSCGPHISTITNIPKVMYGVILALIPATFTGIYLFGWSALKVVVISMLVAVLTEGVIQWILGRQMSMWDGSAALTGLLLALNLPPRSPWWMVLVGAVFAIIIGKQIYGGLGHNPFNPALVARVVLVVSWPVQMTRWIAPLDGVSTATPLGILKSDGIAKLGGIRLFDLFIGKTGGCIGEVSALALLIGFLFLLWKGYVTWHIPVAYMGTVCVFTGVFWLVNPQRYANPAFHLLAGGLVLGACFMATDYVTSPITVKGKIIFGIGCGIITGVIRILGSYPEGVSFSILLMNAAAPLIDQYTRPKRYGRLKKHA